jgi:hypothetical protein
MELRLTHPSRGAPFVDPGRIFSDDTAPTTFVLQQNDGFHTNAITLYQRGSEFVLHVKGSADHAAAFLHQAWQERHSHNFPVDDGMEIPRIDHLVIERSRDVVVIIALFNNQFAHIKTLVVQLCGQFTSLPVFMRSFTALQVLYVGHSTDSLFTLDDDSAGRLKESCTRLRQLYLIKLDLRRLPEPIAHLPNLRDLDVSWNYFLNAVPEGPYPALRTLNLHRCFGVIGLPRGIGQSSTLIDVDLTMTNINDGLCDLVIQRAERNRREQNELALILAARRRRRGVRYPLLPPELWKLISDEFLTKRRVNLHFIG